MEVLLVICILSDDSAVCEGVKGVHIVTVPKLLCSVA